MEKPNATLQRRWLVRAGKWLVRAVVLGLLAWFAWRTLNQSLRDMAESGVSWGELDLKWLSLAGVLYLAGMFPSSLFWFRVLRGMGQQPDYWTSLRSFFVSQPGKYVPGKFMVVLIRTTMIRGPNVNTTLAVAATFVETLTVMSLGAAIGAGLLAVTWTRDWRLAAFAITAAIAAGIPVFPPVFQRLARWTKLHRVHPEIDQALAGLHIGRLAPGWAWLAAGWLVIGCSLWATLQAIPGSQSSGSWPYELALLTASAALSTVAGFASGLPGGLGARELVVMVLIEPHFGGVAAVLSAVVYRCVMIASELLAAGVLYPARGRRVAGG